MPKHPRRQKSAPSHRQGGDIPRWALSFDQWVRYAFGAWLAGVGLPLLVGWIGLQAVITGHATWSRMGMRTAVFNGASARVLGIALIMGAAFVHLSLFWGSHDRFTSYGRKAGFAAAVIGLTLYYIAWTIQVLWG
jgi:hypothetical protein